MRFWKPLSKYRYSDDRDEVKYHSDFLLDEGETIEIILNGETLLKEETPKGKVCKFHFQMAVESFDK